MKIIAYPTTTTPLTIRPANSKRLWMDNAANKNPYRCLPLSMANSWGWEILSNSHFIAEWNGNRAPSDVTIKHIDGTSGPSPHFGEGTLTWHSGHIFKMPYPYGLYVTGAPNQPVANAVPLVGVVESHWLAYTFTLNWKFTQPGSFEMKIGDPICQIFPIDMSTFDNVELEIRSLHEPEAKEFHDDYWNWNISRAKYMNEQRDGMHAADVWQKHYFRGVFPSEVKDGLPMEDAAGFDKKCPFHIDASGKEKSNHRTKPNVPEVVDNQIEPFKTPDNYWSIMKQVNGERDKRKAAKAAPVPVVTSVNNAKELELEAKLREMELKLRIAETQIRLQAIQNTSAEVKLPPKKTMKTKAKIITVEE